ncbi:MAG: hypothetical protein GY863_13870 [bacterium]|nr:hypothetical protein [bacterium]
MPETLARITCPHCHKKFEVVEAEKFEKPRTCICCQGRGVVYTEEKSNERKDPCHAGKHLN